MATPSHLFVMDFEASCDTGDMTIRSIDVDGRIVIPSHRLSTGDAIKYFKMSRDARNGTPMSVAGVELLDGADFFAGVLDADAVMLFNSPVEAQEFRHPVVIDVGTGVNTCIQDQSSTRTISSVDATGRVCLLHHRLCTGAQLVCTQGQGNPLRRKQGGDLEEGAALFARCEDLHTLRLFTTKEGALSGDAAAALELEEGSGTGSAFKVRPGLHWENEIIEFPGVLLNVATMQPVAEFRCLVRPVENPELPAFTTRLTSLTQADVEAGETLDEVLRRLGAWLRDQGAEDALPVTCGDWDLGTMLSKECKRKGFDDFVPPALKRWCNVKRTYEQTLGGRAPGMDGMLQSLQLPLDGHHHLGIDDSRNIAKIVVELVRRGGRIEATTHAKAPKSSGKEKPSEEDTAKKQAAKKQAADVFSCDSGGRAVAYLTKFGWRGAWY